MAEWLFEEGIGENRAALVEAGSILEAVVELPNVLRAGTVAEGRLATILVAGRRAIVRIGDGAELLLEPLPSALTEGQSVRVEVMREVMAEQGRTKLARCRVTDQPLRDGPSLLDRLRERGSVRTVLCGAPGDPFEEAGWSELLDAAATGDIPFPGGRLRMSLTPAMTLFDVDGDLPAAELAIAGAAAAAGAIRRFGIAGSVGIDLPTLPGRADRQAAAAALDSLLPQPFERTGVNGFGFLQVVRRKLRPSLPELIQSDPVGAAARALLRLAERAPGAGARTLRASPAVIDRLDANPDWLETLARRTGALAVLAADPTLGLAAGHVQGRYA